MSMKEALFPLKEEIKKHETESRTLNRAIQQSSGMAKHALRQEKSSLGARTRYLFLAYALLRGRPYTSLERKCADGNHPWPSVVHERALIFDPAITREGIEEWLKRPTEAAEAA